MRFGDERHHEIGCSELIKALGGANKLHGEST